MKPPKNHLLSIDLEDVRLRMENHHHIPDRIFDNVTQLLDFFEKHHTKVTFFTVGDIALHYPDLIKVITQKGHEIACHSLNHKHLDEHTPESFYKDISLCKERLLKCGAKEVIGYRAPRFSMTANTQWAYEMLEKAGYIYSSSVLPGKSPIYGWENFGNEIRKIHGVTEIPISLYPKNSILSLPFSGGVYFRALPFWMVLHCYYWHFKFQHHCTSYFHPYDIDSEVEHFNFPEIHNTFFHWLLYYNRKNTLNRLEKIMNKPYVCTTYSDFVSSLNDHE